MCIFWIFEYEQISSTHSQNIFGQCCFDRAFSFTTILMGFRPVPSTPPILVSQGLSSKLIARRRYCRENFWLQKTESSQLNTAGSVVYRYVYMRIPIHKPTGFTSRPTGYQHPPDRSFLFCILRHSYPCIPPKYPFVSSLEPHRHEKILLQRIHTLANFPFLLLTTSPARWW